MSLFTHFDEWADKIPKHPFNFSMFKYRIAPKRSLADLPIDTLVEVGGKLLYTDGKDSVFLDGSTSATVTVHNPVMTITDFKVIGGLITEWHGGECPVPDWVKVKVWFRDGTSCSDFGAGEFRWTHRDKNSDIMLYQIIGEVE